MSWEPLDVGHGDMFAVIGCEEHSLEPMAIFQSREHAEDWIDYLRNRINEDNRVNIDLVVVHVRCLSGLGWNSVDDPPARGGVGDPGVRDPDSECREYMPGETATTADCESDGHYLCAGCVNYAPRPPVTCSACGLEEVCHVRGVCEVAMKDGLRCGCGAP